MIHRFVVPARNLQPGDVITGVGNLDGTCFNPIRHPWVVSVTPGIAPNGEPMVTVHHGRQEWQCGTYCADTLIRIHRETR